MYFYSPMSRCFSLAMPYTSRLLPLKTFVRAYSPLKRVLRSLLRLLKQRQVPGSDDRNIKPFYPFLFLQRNLFSKLLVREEFFYFLAKLGRVSIRQHKFMCC